MRASAEIAGAEWHHRCQSEGEHCAAPHRGEAREKHGTFELMNFRTAGSVHSYGSAARAVPLRSLNAPRTQQFPHQSRRRPSGMRPALIPSRPGYALVWVIVTTAIIAALIAAVAPSLVIVDQRS